MEFDQREDTYEGITNTKLLSISGELLKLSTDFGNHISADHPVLDLISDCFIEPTISKETLENFELQNVSKAFVTISVGEKDDQRFDKAKLDELYNSIKLVALRNRP